MLAEPLLMRSLNPCSIDWTVEANNRIYAALRTDCSLPLLPADDVTPLRYSRRWKLGEAVVADSHFAGEKPASMHRTVAGSAHGI
jgi:hypothetical protein